MTFLRIAIIPLYVYYFKSLYVIDIKFLGFPYVSIYWHLCIKRCFILDIFSKMTSLMRPWIRCHPFSHATIFVKLSSLHVLFAIRFKTITTKQQAVCSVRGRARMCVCVRLLVCVWVCVRACVCACAHVSVIFLLCVN
jgi:hypothetical protein